MTQFSEQKKADMKVVFDLFDKNGDGYIDPHEIGQLMRSMNLNPTNKEIADLIAEADKNGNQRLDFEEFVTFMTQNYQERDQETELREAFKLFDRDNSGFITISELKQVMMNMGEKLTSEEIEDMMREADLNKDGKLDYHEFARTLLQPN